MKMKVLLVATMFVSGVLGSAKANPSSPTRQAILSELQVILSKVPVGNVCRITNVIVGSRGIMGYVFAHNIHNYEVWRIKAEELKGTRFAIRPMELKSGTTDVLIFVPAIGTANSASDLSKNGAIIDVDNIFKEVCLKMSDKANKDMLDDFRKETGSK